MVNPPKLYLPITEKKLRFLIDKQEISLNINDDFSIHEIAAITIISALPNYKKDYKFYYDEIEKKLINLIEILENTSSNSTFLINYLLEKLTHEKLVDGYRAIKDSDIRFVPSQNIVNKNNLINENGDYLLSGITLPQQNEDVYYLETLRLPLRNEQYRLLNQINKQNDENFEVQGYAGTGKTYLLKGLIEIYSNNALYKPVVISRTYTQLKALKNKLPNIKIETFESLSASIIPEMHGASYLRTLKKQHRARLKVTNEVYARELGIKGVSTLSKHDVVDIIMNIEKRYCYSRDRHIEQKHIPRELLKKLNEDELNYLLTQTEVLRTLRIKPPIALPSALPIFDYHLIKEVAINDDWHIPYNQFTHIIIDESHDLTDAFLQILERSPQVKITLGDKYQNLNGVSYRMETPHLSQELSESIRVPKGHSNLINSILDAHPIPKYTNFTGNIDQRTILIPYDSFDDALSKPSLILTINEWEIFEWIQLVASKDLNFKILGSFQNIDRFVEGVINLYKHNTPSRESILNGLKNWDEVIEKYSNSNPFKHVQKMLERDYSLNDWKKTKLMKNSSAEYVISKYEHSRNYEFRRVTLTPSVVDEIEKLEGLNKTKNNAFSKVIIYSKLYLGITRTQQTLLVPRKFIEFF